jgi:hypothetical protein
MFIIPLESEIKSGKSVNLFVLLFVVVVIVSVVPHVEVGGVLFVLELRNEIGFHSQNSVPVLKYNQICN